MTDPLAGRRESINQGRIMSLVWPDRGEGCPVEADEVFRVRAGGLVILKTYRFQKKSPWKFDREEMPPGWYWGAEFKLFRRVVAPVFLARVGGTTKDRDQAMAAQDDPDPGTVRKIGEDERDPEARAHHAVLGEEPEPELVPHFEVLELRPSREARERYLLEMEEKRAVEANAPLEERMARLRKASANRHVDISPEMRIVEKQLARAAQQLEKAERKVLERAA
jgi:hypothetical protein